MPYALYSSIYRSFAQGLYMQEKFCVPGALYIEVLCRGSICTSFAYPGLYIQKFLCRGSIYRRSFVQGLYIQEKFCVGALYVEVLCTWGYIYWRSFAQGLYIQEKFCVPRALYIYVEVLHRGSIYRSFLYIEERQYINSVPLRSVVFLYIQEGFCAPHAGFLPCHIERILYTLCTI